MLKMKPLLWQVSVAMVALLALVGVGAYDGARAARRATPTASCKATGELSADLSGDGRLRQVRLVRVGNDAWADVWAGDQLQSSTRIGAWHDDAVIEAIDVNGDGKLDLVRRWSEGKRQHAQAWLWDGTAFDEGCSSTPSGTCVAQR